VESKDVKHIQRAKLYTQSMLRFLTRPALERRNQFACKYTYPPLYVKPFLDYLYLLLLLSRFSCVRLFVTPETAAHHASLSLGFSRQEHWRELPFPSPVRQSEVAQSCPTLATPWTAVYQAPPSMGSSRQKYWSGVPLQCKSCIHVC